MLPVVFLIVAVVSAQPQLVLNTCSDGRDIVQSISTGFPLALSQYFSSDRATHYLSNGCQGCAKGSGYGLLRTEGYGFLSACPATIPCVKLITYFNSATRANLVVPEDWSPIPSGFSLWSGNIMYTLSLNYTGTVETSMLELWTGFSYPGAPQDYWTLSSAASRSEAQRANYTLLATLARTLNSHSSDPTSDLGNTTLVFTTTGDAGQFPALCIGLEGNSTLWPVQCTPTRAQTQFSINANTSRIYSRAFLPSQEFCLRAGTPDMGESPAVLPGVTKVSLEPCSLDAGALSQIFTYNATSGRIKHSPSGLCVDAGMPQPYCAPGTPQAGWGICNSSLGEEARVRDLVSRLSPGDRMTGLGTFWTSGLGSINLPPYRWGQEALHGIAAVNNDARTPLQTNVAFPSTSGASFNRSLWHAIGAQLGAEARAFINLGNAYKSFWAPTCNLMRDPRW